MFDKFKPDEEFHIKFQNITKLDGLPDIRKATKEEKKSLPDKKCQAVAWQNGKIDCSKARNLE